MRMKTASSALLQMLLATSLALAGDMSLGPITPAAAVKGQNQFSPDVAFGPSTGSRLREDATAGTAGQGKDGYLAVWQRSRDDGGRVECARLDAAGKPLDPKPLVIAPDAKWQEAPRVSFGNGIYLVVWQDMRNGKEFDIFAARVTPEGKVLDPGGFPVCQTADAASRFPCAAFDGKDFIVVWSELATGDQGNYRLFAARVSPEGKAAAPQPLDIKYEKVPFSKNLKDMVETDMAVCGNRLLVVSGGFDFAQVFNLPDLKPVGPAEGWHPKSDNETLLNHRTYTRRPTVATDGKSFLFSVWGGVPVALLNRVSTDCKVDEAPIFWGGGKLGIMGPALAFDGENYLFVRHRWSSEGGKERAYGVNSHLCARRVTPDGKPLGAADLDVAGTTPDQLNTVPRLASDGKGHVLMVWEQHPAADGGDIVAATRMITTK